MQTTFPRPAHYHSILLDRHWRTFFGNTDFEKTGKIENQIKRYSSLKEQEKQRKLAIYRDSQAPCAPWRRSRDGRWVKAGKRRGKNAKKNRSKKCDRKCEPQAPVSCPDRKEKLRRRRAEEKKRETACAVRVGPRFARVRCARVFRARENFAWRAPAAGLRAPLATGARPVQVEIFTQI